MTASSVTAISLDERPMLAFCRRADEPEIPVGTMRANESTALDFLSLAVPSFTDIITRESRVLDFWCDLGMQIQVLAPESPDTKFVGVDLPLTTPRQSWAAALLVPTCS